MPEPDYIELKDINLPKKIPKVSNYSGKFDSFSGMPRDLDVNKYYLTSKNNFFENWRISHILIFIFILLFLIGLIFYNTYYSYDDMLNRNPLVAGFRHRLTELKQPLEEKNDSSG